MSKMATRSWSTTALRSKHVLEKVAIVLSILRGEISISVLPEGDLRKREPRAEGNLGQDGFTGGGFKKLLRLG